MKKYMVLYHAPLTVIQQMQNSSKEDMSKGMEEWEKWAERVGEHMVDMGTPLMGGTALNVNGSDEQSKRDVCGYSVIQANDMNHAKQLMEGHPHNSGWNDSCQIELHEMMPIPGM